MLRNYSVLIIGNPYDSHFVRFVKYIKKENPLIKLTAFGFKVDGKIISEELANSVEELCLADNNHRCPSIPFIRSIVSLYHIKSVFHRQLSKKRFDIVNIHYPLYFYVFLLRDIKRITHKIIVTPWGSDVYRISWIEKCLLRRLYKNANIVTGYGKRFTDDCKRIFKIPEKKFRNLRLFIDQIDFFVDHKNLFTVKEAKQQLGISDHDYVITCGYNGSPSQRHLDMIEAINGIKDHLPKSFILLFPFTYAGTEDYRNIVKKKVEECGINAVYCERYLDLKDLFILRLATDMFIHIQTTDANNGSLKEYVLLGKNVINGAWLKYDDIEINGNKPYHLVSSLNELGSVIVNAYNDGPVQVSNEVIEIIEHIGCRYWAPKWIEMFDLLVYPNNK